MFFYTPDIHCGDITSIGKSKFHAKSTCWHSPFAIFSLYLPCTPVKGGQGHTGNLFNRQLSVKRKEQPIGFDALIKNDHRYKIFVRSTLKNLHYAKTRNA